MRAMFRPVFFALAIVALTGALTACGVKSTVDPVAAAATKSEQAGGFSATMSVTVSAEGRQFTMTGFGFFGDGKGQMQFDMSDVLSQTGAPTGTDSSIKAIYLTENGDAVMSEESGQVSI